MTNARLRAGTGASLLAAALLLLAGAVSAQEVGTVAAVEGTAEIGSGGSWTTAAAGAPVHRGDQLRTGAPGRMRVVFQDDSVLVVSESSLVTVNEQVFNPGTGKAKSFLELLQGGVNAVVSDYYHRAGNRYEIKTVTAVAGVRGTEFSMSYDPQQDVTEVVGISGHVEVHSMIDPTGPGILLTANEVTTVAHGALPSPPSRLDESLFRQRIEGLDFVGGGRAEVRRWRRPSRRGSGCPPRRDRPGWRARRLRWRGGRRIHDRHGEAGRRQHHLPVPGRRKHREGDHHAVGHRRDQDRPVERERHPARRDPGGAGRHRLRRHGERHPRDRCRHRGGVGHRELLKQRGLTRGRHSA